MEDAFSRELVQFRSEIKDSNKVRVTSNSVKAMLTKQYQGSIWDPTLFVVVVVVVVFCN